MKRFAIALVLALAASAGAAAPFDARDPISWVHDRLWPRPPAPAPPIVELPPVTIAPVVPEQAPPVVVIVPAPVQPARPKPKPRPRPANNDDDDRPVWSRPAANCRPITIDCSTVCSYARRFSLSTLESMGLAFGYCPPTASQRAQGRACMRKQCPEVLKP